MARRKAQGLMADQRGHVVAVVDDDAGIRESLQFLLSSFGHLVATYASAMEFLNDVVSRPACLIVDYNMPGMTGLELAERLRGDGNAIPILLITGAPSAAIISGAARAGIRAVLGKPAPQDDVLSFVKDHTAPRG